MMIYYFLLIEILALGFLMRVNNTSKWRKVYCYIIGITLFIISALRNISVGGDSFNYADLFYTTKMNSYMGIISSGTRDIGYFLFAKTIGLFTGNHQWLFAFVAALFSISVSIYIYRYSKDIILSYLVLISFSFFQFSMTGLRQTMAFSILLFSVKMAHERKLMRFLFVVFIATLFHRSALIFLLVYLMTYIKINALVSLLLLFILGLTQVFNQQLFHIFISFTDQGYTFISGGGGETMLIVLFLLFLFGLFFQKSYKQYNDNSGFDYTMIFTGVFFQILTPVQNIFFRIAMYFTLSLAIFIPCLIKAIPDVALRRTGITFMYLVLSIQYLFFTITAAYVTPYKFFWQ